MESKTAIELMVPLDDYPKVSLYSTIRDAIEIMQSSTIEHNNKKSMPRSLLVFDKQNQLVGMIRRRDILNQLEPQRIIAGNLPESAKMFGFEVDPELLELSYKNFMRSIILHASKTVGEVMTPIEHFVNHNDHLIKIIFELNHYRQTLIPVVKDDSVIGVLRTVEIMGEIASILNIKS